MLPRLNDTRSLIFFLLILLLTLTLLPLLINVGVGLYSSLSNLNELEQKYESNILQDRVSPLQDHINIYKTLTRFVSQLPAVAEILGKGKTRPGSIEKKQAFKRYSGVIKRAFADHPSIVSVAIYDTNGLQRLKLNRDGDRPLQTVPVTSKGNTDNRTDYSKVLTMAPGSLLLNPRFLKGPSSEGRNSRRLLLRMLIPIQFKGEIIGLYEGDIDLGVLSLSFPNINWVFGDGRNMSGEGISSYYNDELSAIFATGKVAMTHGNSTMAWLPLFTDEKSEQTLWAGQKVTLQTTQSSKTFLLWIFAGTFILSCAAIVLVIFIISKNVKRFLENTLECIEAGISDSEAHICSTPTGFTEVDDFLTKLDDLVLVHQQMERERLRNEQLRRDFERLFHHDLRSPISGILSVPQLIKEAGELSPEQEELLDLVELASYKVMGLIKISLDLPRLERGDYSLQLASFDLAKVINRIFKLLSANLSGFSPRARLLLCGESTELNTPYIIHADEILCFSMLTNLIKNALEAAPHNTEITVNLEPLQDGEGHKRTLIRISNQGAVPAEIQDRFFEKYITSSKSGGLGLGTYSAYLVAKAHGGDIELITSEDEGTSVIISLPSS